MGLTELLPLKVKHFILTLLHSEWPKLYGVLAVLSAVGLNDGFMTCDFTTFSAVFQGDVMVIMKG